MRHVTSIHDLRVEEILQILASAKRIEAEMGKYRTIFADKLMATLFFEPSTRTRLSFETAILRGGGNLIHHEDSKSSSFSKGERLSDEIKVVSSYVDVIVIRHPWEGAARRAAEVSTVPVINGGDGSHEHPTQTLCDLYAMYKQFDGKFDGLRVLVRGDLKYGRTVHSLVQALAMLGANIFVSHPPGLGLPDYISEILKKKYKKKFVRGGEPSKEGQRDAFPKPDDSPLSIDAVYVTTSEPPTLLEAERNPDAERVVKSLLRKFDAIYLTRVQRERFASVVSAQAAEQQHGQINKKVMKDRKYANAIIMHPLPRVNEISPDLDRDPRSKYFDQAKGGVPVRMALLNWLLNRSHEPILPNERQLARAKGLKCQNENCVTRKEEDGGPGTFIVSQLGLPTRLHCNYCDSIVSPGAIGNSKKKILLDSRKAKHAVSNIYFESEEDAVSLGYKKGKQSGIPAG